MAIFDNLGKAAPQAVNSAQMLQSLKSDPSGMLQKAGLTIPAGMSDPRQIINHLLSSGQVPQSRITQLMQMMGRR